MTKEEFFKICGLNERKVETSIGTVTIRDLTIKEMSTLQTLDESDMLVSIVSKCLVEPKLTVEELESAGAKGISFLTEILNEVNGQN